MIGTRESMDCSKKKKKDAVTKNTERYLEKINQINRASETTQKFIASLYLI